MCVLASEICLLRFLDLYANCEAGEEAAREARGWVRVRVEAARPLDRGAKSWSIERS